MQQTGKKQLPQCRVTFADMFTVVYSAVHRVPGAGEGHSGMGKRMMRARRKHRGQASKKAQMWAGKEKLSYRGVRVFTDQLEGNTGIS